MNRLVKLFEGKKADILNIYFTAGYPKINDTTLIAQALEKSGADIIEIGMPYSDPVADGPVIQKSSEKSLENGMSIKLLFEQLKDIRETVSIPIVLMGYVNPVMQYGIEAFCQKAAEVGVDGLIIPDLPFKEFNEMYRPTFEANQLSNVFLVTPQTSAARMKQIDDSASGFIYAVSTNSTTGNESKSLENQEEYFTRLKNSELKNPVLIGFNIKDRATYLNANQYANGAIIGSAFIKTISESTDIPKDIETFVQKIKQD
jgi:tryptophan synthase alpha chain